MHVTVPSSVADGTVLSNSATVTTDGTNDPSAGNNTSNTTSTTVHAQADLTVAKSAPATAIAGDPAGFDYMLTVTNNGPSDNAGGFHVRDALPAGTSFQSGSSSAACSASGQNVTCSNTIGLAAGVPQVFTVHVKVASSVADGTVLSNSATVASDGTTDQTAGNNTSNTTSTTVHTQADLSVAKSAPGTAIAGDPAGFDYTLTVTNNGPSDNTGGFHVSDTLPAGTSFQSGSSSASCSAVGQNVTCSNTSGLAAGGTAGFTVHVKVASSVAEGTVLSNTGTVTTDGTSDPTAGNNASNTTSTTVHTQADLSVAKSAPSTTIAGAAAGFDYTLTVTNNGPSDNAGGFHVSDALPAGTSFQSGGSSASCSASGQNVTCSNTSGLAAGGTASFTVHVTVPSSVADGTVLSNSATVNSDGTSDQTSGNNTSNTTSTTVHAQADLTVAKSAPATAIAGDPAGFDYMLTVTNNGPSDNAGGFHVSDTLPAGTSFQSGSSSAACSASGQNVTCSNTTGLAAGVPQVFTVHVKVASSVPDGTVLSNSATVTSDGTTDQTAGNNTSNTTSTTVHTQADLSVAKSAPATAIAGDPAGFDYTLTVTNNGPSDNMGGFHVSDALPAGTSFQGSGSSAACSAAGQNVTCSNTSGLAAGGTQTFTVHVTVASSVAEGTVLSNSGTVTSDGTSDPNSGNDTSNTTSTTVHTLADLSVAKSAPSDTVAGDRCGLRLHAGREQQRALRQHGRLPHLGHAPDWHQLPELRLGCGLLGFGPGRDLRQHLGPGRRWQSVLHGAREGRLFGRRRHGALQQRHRHLGRHQRPEQRQRHQQHDLNDRAPPGRSGRSEGGCADRYRG